MALKFSIKLRKTGKSLSVSIPKPAVDGLGWKEKDVLTLTVTDDNIIVEKPKPAKS